MSHVPTSVLVLLSAVLLWPAAAAGQESNIPPAGAASAPAPAGWSVTPSMTYAGGWDDNILVRGNGDATASGYLSVINPRATVELNGRRGQLTATYDGAFALYRDLGTLNSYDQHLWFSGRRLLSPHLALFVRNNAASVPTTELSQFINVPFVRTGSRLEDLRAGVEAALSKRTSVVASYDFQWVEFDRSRPGAEALRGGHSQGATLAAKHLATPRLTMTADYDVQHALIGSEGLAFDVQNVWAGGDYKVSDATHVFASAGVSRLGVSQVSDVRMGPAWRLGLVRQFNTAGLDLLYSRSFVPSYGFGGTTQDAEATARLRLPLSRRVYTTSALSWRRNDPLTSGELPLQSIWLEATLGYAVTPWVRLEGFYTGTRQTVDRPGGTLNRNRIGFQVTTAKPVRVQ